MSRRARSRKEGSFLESVKGALDTLLREINELKSDIRLIQEACFLPPPPPPPNEEPTSVPKLDLLAARSHDTPGLETAATIPKLVLSELLEKSQFNTGPWNPNAEAFSPLSLQLPQVMLGNNLGLYHWCSTLEEESSEDVLPIQSDAGGAAFASQQSPSTLPTLDEHFDVESEANACQVEVILQTASAYQTSCQIISVPIEGMTHRHSSFTSLPSVATWLRPTPVSPYVCGQIGKERDASIDCQEELIDFTSVRAFLKDKIVNAVEFYPRNMIIRAFFVDASWTPLAIEISKADLKLLLSDISEYGISFTSLLNRNYVAEVGNTDRMPAASSGQMRMKKYSFKRQSPPVVSPPQLENAEWKIIEEPLHACLEAIQANFSPMYQGLLQEERTRIGNYTLVTLPVDRRQSAIIELVEFCIKGMLQSLSSDRAKQALEINRSRIYEFVLEGVVKMFDTAELDR